MISLLASPSVCVIDDEKEEYEVILGALNRLCVPAHHIKGTDLNELPAEPFRGVRLVFQDLHLGGEIGKTAASRAANFFTKTVHPESAPVVVVIWSKHTDELVASEEPEDDQPTVSDLFKEGVLASDDAYKSRLIFIEMKKPQPGDRPESEVWISELVTEINLKLSNAPATSLLWEWEQTVKAAAAKVVDQLVSFSSCPISTPAQDEGMKVLLSCLASAHSEGDLDTQTAPRHVASALSQLLSDQLEHNSPSSRFLTHGEWLKNRHTLNPAVGASLNGLLMTSESNTDGTAYAPGEVYRIQDEALFTHLFDEKIGILKYECFNPLQANSEEEAEEKRKRNDAAKREWNKCTEPVFVELSPVCDVAHKGKRTTATLVAGLVAPASFEQYVKRTGAFHALPIFTLRQAGGTLAANTEVIVVINSKYRTALPSKTEEGSLARWFRIRELPTASIRTWLASQIARVGFVSL